MLVARAWSRTPAGRGFVLATIATATTGFAMAAQQNIVANFFEHQLGFSGPQFGYITAIREVPGFLLIFLTALFFRLSLPHLTAGALVVLALGYGFFGFAWSFWSVVPWVVLSSMGYHTWLQTQYALGMSLTSERRSGTVLGRLSAINNAGGLVAMFFVLVAFQFQWLSFRATFAVCGALALIAAVAIVRFPQLHDGELAQALAPRQPIVLRREYRYYYLLNLLDGARMQIFFSFGLWVLVHRFNLSVPVISAVLILSQMLGMTLAPRIGRLVDQYGERRMLAGINVAYVVALLGYALASQVAIVVFCYVIYMFIFPLSQLGSATYLRKVATRADVAPSLAMGLTLQHAAAVIVPVTTGYVLNFAGYQLPFLIASVFASITFFVTRKLSPETQKSAARLREEWAEQGERFAAADTANGAVPASNPAR